MTMELWQPDVFANDVYRAGWASEGTPYPPATETGSAVNQPAQPRFEPSQPADAAHVGGSDIPPTTRRGDQIAAGVRRSFPSGILGAGTGLGLAVGLTGVGIGVGVGAAHAGQGVGAGVAGAFGVTPQGKPLDPGAPGASLFSPAVLLGLGLILVLFLGGK
jgi:hypothetical protein